MSEGLGPLVAVAGVSAALGTVAEELGAAAAGVGAGKDSELAKVEVEGGRAVALGSMVTSVCLDAKSGGRESGGRASCGERWGGGGPATGAEGAGAGEGVGLSATFGGGFGLPAREISKGVDEARVKREGRACERRRKGGGE